MLHIDGKKLQHKDYKSQETRRSSRRLYGWKEYCILHEGKWCSHDKVYGITNVVFIFITLYSFMKHA